MIRKAGLAFFAGRHCTVNQSFCHITLYIPGRVAQSVARITEEPEVLGSISLLPFYSFSCFILYNFNCKLCVIVIFRFRDYRLQAIIEMNKLKRQAADYCDGEIIDSTHVHVYIYLME